MKNTNHDVRPSVSGKTRVLRIPGGKTKSNIKIGTWNVRSLYEAGKLNNTISEMNRLEIDILGISETWWEGNGEFKSENTIIYHSGNHEGCHRRGVGVIINENIAKCVAGYVPMSDRTMLVKIDARPLNINIIQVYAPTSDSSVEEIEEFYEEIEKLLKMTKPHEITIIQGDFNAKVGEIEVPGVAGRYGLGVRNERGDRLIQFCQEHNMKITNTLFRLHPRRLYTWKSPRDSQENVIRNQIDYILINRRYCTCVTKCSTFPGADVPSDHNLLLSSIRAKIAVVRKKKQRSKINVEKLKDPSVKEVLKDRINSKLEEIDRDDLGNMWNNLKTNINAIASTLGNNTTPGQEEWITDEIKKLRIERSKHKNNNYERYWEINKEIRNTTRAAKNALLSRKCQEIEILQSMHDDFNLHKKLKEAAGIYRNSSPGVIFDENNIAVFEISERKRVWTEYVTKTFTDEGRSPIDRSQYSLTGAQITINEVEYAINSLKDKKATGPDEIPSEILKLIDGENINLLVTLFNHIYDTGQYPVDWLKSTFITIPKKKNARKCEEYRLISLMSHALKIFLRIIHRRIYSKCEMYMGTSQFGFKEGMGTREALISIQVLIQNCRNVQKDVFLCFIDYEKAFDTVQHNKLMEILISIGIDGKDIRCIENLYWDQTARIDVNGELTDEIFISRGVRQGCILSPLLFNIYSQRIFMEAINNERIGIRTSGVIINNIRYADDTTLLASSMCGLQKLLDKLTSVSESYGLRINTKKTKYMIISRKNKYNNTTLKIREAEIEKVKNFKYLGVLINDQWDISNEIRCRIEMAREAFFKYYKILTSHDIGLQTKTRFIKCYVWSVLLYAAETWTIKSNDVNKLEAFEMWIYRRILKIPWTDRVTNNEVLRRMNVERQLIATIKSRKISYLGHLMRNNKYQLIQTILKGKIEGKPARGRKETTWLKNIKDWTGYHDERTLFNAAKNRELLTI